MGKFVSLAPVLKGTAGEGAHPICVIKKLREKNLLDDVMRYRDNPLAMPEHLKKEVVEAAVECKREGKLHGIYKLVRQPE